MSWICTAGRSPATCQMCLAVAFELSIFLANCQTLLARNFCMLTLPSFIVLVTKSSSFIKNQKISLCNILAVSGRYFTKLTCTCTALYHLSTFQLPCQKLVSKSNQALTLFVWGFENSLNLVQMASHVSSSLGMLQDT